MCFIDLLKIERIDEKEDRSDLSNPLYCVMIFFGYFFRGYKPHKVAVAAAALLFVDKLLTQFLTSS